MSLLTRLGINCSLIIFSHISKFFIVLGIFLVKNESFFFNSFSIAGTSV